MCTHVGLLKILQASSYVISSQNLICISTFEQLDILNLQRIDMIDTRTKKLYPIIYSEFIHVRDWLNASETSSVAVDCLLKSARKLNIFKRVNKMAFITVKLIFTCSKQDCSIEC